MTEPVPKMPRGRLFKMVAVTFTLEILQTMCALLVVFAPLFLCTFAQFFVTDWTNSKTAGDLACWVAGIGGVAAYLVPGAVAAVAFVGWGLGAMVSAIIFFISSAWFKLIGVNFLDRMGSKLWISLGFLAFEALPFFGVLPLATISTYIIARQVQKEDKEALEKYTRELRRKEGEEDLEEARQEQVEQIRARQSQENEIADMTAANDNLENQNSQAA